MGRIIEQPVWRLELYDVKKPGMTGYLTDISNIFTSSLSIKKERNKPDEVTFTLDLTQLQNRASSLGMDPRQVIEPYRHRVKIYRNNKYVTQAIVQKVSVNLNNQGKNTVEVSCVDLLGLLEKRLIHQDYGEGSWADFAARAIMDAQHEPNRIYNYAWEGDGTDIDNAWFRGWKFTPGEALAALFPEWMPNKKYNPYDKCTFKGKFWECNELHISEEDFQESKWEELGNVIDEETGEAIPIYGVWREDNEVEGPTGTKLGGWAGTSSCHMTAQTLTYNTPISGSVNLANSSVSTSLVSPFEKNLGRLYCRVAARKIATSSVEDLAFKFFIEGYGGSNHQESGTMTVANLAEWTEVEYLFPQMDFDIYRFGIKIISGEGVFDSPVCYKEQINNDEWDLGIRLGDFPSEVEQAKAGWDKHRFTPTYEWKKALETLQDLSNMDSDNFWFSLDENNKFHIYIHGGTDVVRLDLSYPKNITSMTVETNAVDMVNYMKGDGSAEIKQDPLVSGVENFNSAPFTWIGYDMKAMQDYWPLAAAQSFNSERTIENLRNDIAAQIATYADLLDVPQIKVENGTINPDQIALGDVVSVTALNTPYVQRINGLYKIFATQIDTDFNNVENISITLIVPSANQLNALSFPELIKNFMVRVRNA